MFDNLSGRFSHIVKQLRGHARLTEDNIATSLREVRLALLEADVAVPVVRDFVERIRERALGREVAGSLTPGQAVIKMVREELIDLMGAEQGTLNLKVAPPAVILLAGLARRRQDHHCRQAWQVVQGKTRQVSVGMQLATSTARRPWSSCGYWRSKISLNITPPIRTSNPWTSQRVRSNARAPGLSTC